MHAQRWQLTKMPGGLWQDGAPNPEKDTRGPAELHPGHGVALDPSLNLWLCLLTCVTGLLATELAATPTPTLPAL